jgi:TonB family protein
MVHFTVETKASLVRQNRVLLVPTVTRQRVKRAIRTAPKAHQVQIQAALPPPKLPAFAPPVYHPEPVIETPRIVVETRPESPPVTHVATKPPAQVQTGGFAAASTAPVQTAKAAQIVAAGFGDAVAPPSAGQRRASSVATAGFGDTGVLSPPARERAAVRSSGFGDAVAAPSARGTRLDATPAITVAQILEKPRPAYSEEARRLQIEGEVQLEILFGASGEIRILRVVRGLGHGLDENAVQAARTIRFLPARRDGRPVDSTATVHIIFQLAS